MMMDPHLSGMLADQHRADLMLKAEHARMVKAGRAAMTAARREHRAAAGATPHRFRTRLARLFGHSVPRPASPSVAPAIKAATSN